MIAGYVTPDVTPVIPRWLPVASASSLLWSDNIMSLVTHHVTAVWLKAAIRSPLRHHIDMLSALLLNTAAFIRFGALRRRRCCDIMLRAENAYREWSRH